MTTPVSSHDPYQVLGSVSTHSAIVLGSGPHLLSSFRDNVQRSAPIYPGSHSEKVAQLDLNPVWFDPKSMPSSGYSDSYRDIWASSMYSF